MVWNISSPSYFACLNPYPILCCQCEQGGVSNSRGICHRPPPIWQVVLGSVTCMCLNILTCFTHLEALHTAESGLLLVVTRLEDLVLGGSNFHIHLPSTLDPGLVVQ